MRLTFRRAVIYPSEAMDEDGYWTPRIDLVNNVHAKPYITFRFYFEVHGRTAPFQLARRGSECSTLSLFYCSYQLLCLKQARHIAVTVAFPSANRVGGPA